MFFEPRAVPFQPACRDGLPPRPRTCSARDPRRAPAPESRIPGYPRGGGVGHVSASPLTQPTPPAPLLAPAPCSRPLTSTTRPTPPTPSSTPRSALRRRCAPLARTWTWAWATLHAHPSPALPCLPCPAPDLRHGEEEATGQPDRPGHGCGSGQVGSEGAQPPASSRRGHAKCGHGGVCWLSRLSGVRQARPPQPRTLPAQRAASASSTRSRAPRSSEALGYAMSCRGASILGWLTGEPAFRARCRAAWRRPEAVEPKPCRELGAGEHAAMQARQGDPLRTSARQVEPLQRPLAALRWASMLRPPSSSWRNGDEPFGRKSTRRKPPKCPYCP